MNKLLFIVFFSLNFNTFSQETITASQAKDFVGKEVFLIGKVAGTKIQQTKSGENLMFINIDKKYPENDFVIVVFSDVLSKLKLTEADFYKINQLK